MILKKRFVRSAKFVKNEILIYCYQVAHEFMFWLKPKELNHFIKRAKARSY
jgi:hypothetical protein